MTDTLVLLAMSQVICLGAVAYLHRRLVILQRRIDGVPAPVRRRAPEPYRDARPASLGVSATTPSDDLTALVARMHELGIDVATVARRMHRSEDEVRSLLHARGVRA